MSYFGYDTFKRDVLDAINDASETYDVTGELLLSELHLVLSVVCSEVMNGDRVWKEAYEKGRAYGISQVMDRIQQVKSEEK